MGRPNILLVVWDACRLDAARKYAPTLDRLADDNLWFENAIAPAGQSLGSHVSMFTGEYPHQHGIYTQSDIIESPLPLVDRLGADGYARYAVSANGFAAPKYGFDRGFDEFYNTQGLTAYPQGLDVHGYARQIREANDGEFDTGDIAYSDLLGRTLRHDYPVKSLANVCAAALSELVNAYPALQRIPHRRFNKYNEFSYSPEQNTECIRRLVAESASGGRPFFIFTNYMDTHHPYTPPEPYQREYCGRTFSYRELSRIAEESHPFNYLKRRHGEGVSEPRIETIRNLYAGEVRTADEHLGRLLRTLERQEVRDETLIIVTADHGENLGETNWMGEKHMGHVRSASENHLRVPLVVAHPELNSRTVRDYVSTREIYRLLVDEIHPFLSYQGGDISALTPENDVVLAEVPKTTSTALAETYPELSDVLQRHLVAAYKDGWKVVVDSNGTELAWNEGNESDVDGAPSDAVREARRAIGTFNEQGESQREISDTEKRQLEALGYL